MNKKLKLSFKFKYLVCVLLLLSVSLLAIAYVWTLLDDYESSQPERRVEEQIELLEASAADGTIWNKYALPSVPESKYDTTNPRQLYTDLIKNGNLTYKLKPGTFSETSLVYEIISENGFVIADVTLESVGEPVTKLAVFTIQEWKTLSVDMVVDSKNYTIEAPADFTVTLNGIALDPSEAAPLSDGSVKYTCENIIVKPSIEITSPEGQAATYKFSGTRIKTVFYDYSLTLPESLVVYLNGLVHEGTNISEGTVRHEIRELEEPEVKITDLMGNTVEYTGGSSLPLTFCQIICDENNTVTVGGTPIPDSMKTFISNPDLEPIADFVNGLPRLVSCNIAVLEDNASVVVVTPDGTAFSIDTKQKIHDLTNMKTGYEVPEDIAAEIDVLATAKKWSLFMSKDLTGNNYGFWDLANSLVKDSYLYNVAYKYATGIDITFTSIHTLKNPPFVNETVDNFKWITDDCFSVDIGFDKLMVLGDGRDLTDTMYSTFYFVKNERTGNAWKLILIKEIVE